MAQDNNDFPTHSQSDPVSGDASQNPPQGGSASPCVPPQPSSAQSQAQQPQSFQTAPQGQANAGWQAPPYGQQGWGAPYGYSFAAPAPAPAPAPQKKSRAWIVALVAVVLVFVLVAMGMNSCTSLLSSSVGLASDAPSDADLLTQDAVAVVTISGTIQYDGTTSSPEGLKAVLDEAEANPHIRALVLRVDSGGGVATAGEEMASYLRDFSKPVVVSSASTNASAAYEISSQADYIFTAKSTAIGAIGTAMQITDTSELLDKLGINVENITSSDSKDSSYGTRPLTDEERAYYQDMVNQINDVFIENVAQGRGMSVDEVRALATGMTFTGTDAVENGLADQIGTKEDAVAKAADLAGVSDYAVVSLDPSSDDLSQLLDLLAQSEESSASVAGALADKLGATE